MFKLFVIIVVVALRIYAQQGGNGAKPGVTPEPRSTPEPTTTPEPPTDYCDPKLCYGKWIHVGCRAGMDKIVPMHCKGVISFPVMDEDRIKLVLHIHNRIRNEVAEGNHLWFDKAAKMGVVQWDKELEKLAVLNLHSCLPQTDTCRNTRKFRMVGQNVARSSGPARHVHDMDVILEHQIMYWYNQSQFVHMTDIRYLKRPHRTNVKKAHIDTFTQLVQDRLKYIGCAMMIRNDTINWYQSLCCNYSFKNLLTKQVYKVSSVIGEKCTEKDKNYTSLCTKDQVYEDLPNVYY